MSNIPDLAARQQTALQKVSQDYPAEKTLALSILEAAEYLRDTKRWKEARLLADYALTITLRWHYFTYTGQRGMTSKTNSAIIQALRSAGVIDREVFGKLSGYIDQPNDRRGLYNTLQAVRLFANAMIEPIEDNGRSLDRNEARTVYRGHVGAGWHFEASRAALEETEPTALEVVTA
jgi:hypothetical protein